MAEAGKSLIFETLSEIPDEEQEWIWRGRIPRDKVTLLDGVGGTGKTRSLANVLTRVIKRETLPDGQVPECDPGHVFFITRESNGAELRRVFRAQGLESEDLEYIHRIPGVYDNGKKMNMLLNIEVDIPVIAQAIQKYNPIAMVLDPLLEFHTRNSIRDHEIRALMSFLDDVAQRYHLAIIPILHWNKNDEGQMESRAAGSHQYTAAVKSRITLVRDKKDESLVAFFQTKHNLSPPSPPLSFQVDEEKGEVVWAGVYQDIPDDGAGVQAAKRWLQEVLPENGPMTVEECVKVSGIGRSTLFEAKRRLPDMFSVYVYVGDLGKQVSHWDIRCERNLFGLAYEGGVKIG